jgi:hypothetical protein
LVRTLHVICKNSDSNYDKLTCSPLKVEILIISLLTYFKNKNKIKTVVESNVMQIYMGRSHYAGADPCIMDWGLKPPQAKNFF